MAWIEHDHPSSDALDRAARRRAGCDDLQSRKPRTRQRLAGAGRRAHAAADLSRAGRAALRLASLTRDPRPTSAGCRMRIPPAIRARCATAFARARRGIVVESADPRRRRRTGIARPDPGDARGEPATVRCGAARHGRRWPFRLAVPGRRQSGRRRWRWTRMSMPSPPCPIHCRPKPRSPRISLTLPRLLRARDMHLVVTGEDKRRVLRQAQHRGDAAGGIPRCWRCCTRAHQSRADPLESLMSLHPTVERVTARIAERSRVCAAITLRASTPPANRARHAGISLRQSGPRLRRIR